MKMPAPEQLLLSYIKLEPRVRYAALAGLAAFILVIYVALVYWGQTQTLGSLEENLRVSESSRAEKNAIASNLPRYQGRLDELSHKLQTARAMLPDEADVPQFLALLGQKARDVGLTIERFEPKGELNHDFFAEVRFKIQAKGTFHQIGQFLDQMSKMDRIVNISNLTMAQPKWVSHRVELSSTFLLRIYRSLTPEQIKIAEEAKKKEKH